jgi:phosphoribosylaminoimidazole-succinocarboxamide synthase
LLLPTILKIKMSELVYETKLEQADLIKRGKVRDIYDLGDNLLIVATDRVSCFDVVLPTPIPFKGAVLTQISRFWFEMFKDLMPHHLISTELSALPPALAAQSAALKDRFMIVQKVKPLEIECVVRGYLAGSGFKEYKKSQSVCSISLPAGLQQADKLPEPIFTPSTKADEGHDENISEDQARAIVGDKVFEEVKAKSIALYTKASEFALTKGIIIADTKFEFGIYQDQVILIDEILTPDSSRFWPQAQYQPGCSPISFDKQFVRDYLESLTWDKTPPGPQLPQEIADKTKAKYLQVYSLLTGTPFSGTET